MNIIKKYKFQLNITTFKSFLMLEKTENFIESLIKTFTLKRVIVFVLLLFSFFFFQHKINGFIESYLLTRKEFSNSILDTILFLCSIYFSIYFFLKIFKDKYIPSYTELISSVGFVLLFSYYLVEVKALSWEFTSLRKFGYSFKYIYFLLIPISIFNVSHFLRFFYISFFVDKKIVNRNYLDDIPINNIINDELDYGVIAKKLTDVLKKQVCQKSFTIGLVGPWGNGKSSIINLVESELQPKLSFFERIITIFSFSKNKDIIVIHFLPYLNHKEEDIISEFFVSLSKELSRFNGKLSNQILDYSKRLTSLYKEKKIIELFEPESFKTGNTPSKQLYDEINLRLKEINKKIIVFVDDLDRLNENEILQVLKLIRNTADFYNTIFVVAMDKDYVINRLKNNNEILDSKFIDKFFQLEIYLPELETKKLREYFIRELLKSSLISNSDFESKLETALKDQYNLFDDYIKNFRDAKRVINQLIFEYPFFESELDLKDFMNFIYFKLKFPKLVKILNDNRNSLLEIDNSGELYELKKIKSSSTNQNFLNTKSIKNILISMQGSYVSVDKYLLFEELKMNDLSINDFLNIDKEDFNLLIKTLACLFGEENEIINRSSIKFENNFRKLMQQKYMETDLLEQEFQTLFIKSKDDSENMAVSYDLPFSQLDKLFIENKLNELLKRFEYFNSQDISLIKWSILILAILYEKRFEYKLNESEILKLMHNFVDKRIELNVEKKAVGSWIINNLFEDILSTENQLLLYGEIWKSKMHSHLWDINEEHLSQIITPLFEKYLLGHNEKGFSVDDYSLYKVYHSIKNIGKVNSSVKAAFIAFWNSSNVELLCTQIIDMASFSNSSFKLSDVSAEIFGSKNDFINFVEKLESDLDSVKEFLRLFKLFKITNHSREIIFEFKSSSKMIQKISLMESHPSRSNFDEYDNRRQVFFESNNDEIIYEAIKDEILKDKYGMSAFSFENKHYLLVHFDKNLGGNVISLEFSQTLIQKIIPKTTWEQKSFSLNGVLDYKPFYTSGENYIKISSIEPKFVK